MIYFILASIIFLLAIPQVILKRSHLQLYSFSVCTYTVFCIYVIFIGLRFETGGADWISYESFYNSLEPLNEVVFSYNYSQLFFSQHGFEFLFKAYSSTLKFFTANYIFLNLFSQLVIAIILFSFFQEYSPYPVLSLFLYFCSMALLADMTVVRQMLAVSIIIISLKYAVSADFLRFFLCVLVATFFHYSAVLFCFFYFYYRTLVFQKFWFYITFLLLSLIVFSGGWVSALLEILTGGNLLGAALQFKMTAYLDEASYSESVFGFGMYERIVLLVSYFFLGAQLKAAFPRSYNLIFGLLVLNLLLSVVLFDFQAFYLRFRYYVAFANFVAYAQLLFLFKHKIVGLVVLLFYGMLWIYLVVYSNVGTYLPYQNYLEVVFGQYMVDRRSIVEIGVW